MTENKCCSSAKEKQGNAGHELVKIEKPTNTCQMCEDYSKNNEQKPVAIMCCEGACLRGEIARQAANILCYKLASDKTVRICLGGAFTKDTGQRSLVREASKLIAIEGCFLECSTRMMKGVIPGLDPKVIIADSLYSFDQNLFSINEMPEEEIRIHAQTVADKLFSDL
ncbi:MAG: putative zinc-binding protein [Deltaproteobacteria bacterium]|nr:putative zinc-binding protein [Deltaproteobacteria bacterium]